MPAAYVRCADLRSPLAGREPEEPRGSSSPEKVVLGDQVKRPLRVFPGVGYIAQNQGEAGTPHGDRTGEASEFRFVQHDHLRRMGVRSITRVGPIGCRIWALPKRADQKLAFHLVGVGDQHTNGTQRSQRT